VRIDIEILGYIPEPIAIHGAETLKFLDKAKIRTGEQVCLSSDNQVTVSYATPNSPARLSASHDKIDLLDIPLHVKDLDKVTDRLVVEGGSFLKYLARAQKSASKDEARINLTWICTTFSEGNVSFTSTDGHRLYHVVTKGYEGDSTLCTTSEDPLFLTETTTKIVLDLLDPAGSFQLNIQKGKDSALWEIIQNNVKITVRTDLYGRFPDFSQILPRVSKDTALITVPCEDLVEACDLVSAFKQNGIDQMIMSFEGDKLTCSNHKVTQNIVAPRNGNHKNSVKVGINPIFFKEGVMALAPDGVKKKRSMIVKVWDTISPILIENSSLESGVLEEFQVVMPMRI
jgi:DNA polymerase III sliding clamp (beta) subunit (PCNA family)